MPAQVEDAFDTVVAAAAAVGPNFRTFAPVLLPLIIARVAPANNVTLRSTSVGCLAEVVEAIGEAAVEFLALLVPVFVAATGDKETEVSSNAAYAIGVLGEAVGQHISQHVPTILQALSANCIGTKRDTQSAVDNACGAVARLILAVPTTVPLASVVPVLLQNMPLKEDTTENAVVYKCIDALARHEQGFALIQPALPHLLAAFCYSAGKNEVDPDTGMRFAALCQWLSQTHAATFNGAVATLSAEHTAVMQAASAALTVQAAAVAAAGGGAEAP
jgi:hypothetical protein